MKVIETTATVDGRGQLRLDSPLTLGLNQRVRVIVLITDDEQLDPDDTPNDVVLQGLREGLKEALSGQAIPLSQMWDGIDVE
ncbi:MAG: hypothetical protein AAGN15_05235 [Cyanobacteria bacterium J06581_3]